MTKIAAAVVAILMFAAPVLAEEPKILSITGEISDDTADTLTRALDGAKPGDRVTIRIDSIGGSMMAGLHIVEAVTQSGVVATCEVGGTAISMAAVILESPACSYRVVRPWSIIMFHGVSLSTSERIDRAKLRELMESASTIERSIALLVAPRLGITVEEYARKTATAWWMTGREAVEYGAADTEKS